MTSICVMFWCLFKLNNFSKMCHICFPIIYSCFQFSDFSSTRLDSFEHSRFSLLNDEKSAFVRHFHNFICSATCMRFLHKHSLQIANMSIDKCIKSFLTLLMKLYFIDDVARVLNVISGNWLKREAGKLCFTLDP